MTVVFSAEGVNHTSFGNPDLLGYSPVPLCNVGNAWDKLSTFTVPKDGDGAYVFILTFVKDAYQNGGTEDDVYMQLRLNGKDVGLAWSGEGAGKRGTGAYSVALVLKKNDKVTTWAGSDGGKTRHIARYQFSGFLVN